MKRLFVKSLFARRLYVRRLYVKRLFVKRLFLKRLFVRRLYVSKETFCEETVSEETVCEKSICEETFYWSQNVIVNKHRVLVNRKKLFVKKTISNIQSCSCPYCPIAISSNCLTSESRRKPQSYSDDWT